MTLPDPSMPWPIPAAAVALIAESEGLRLKAYRCPAGVYTIGWGETDGVHPGDTCTKHQADTWLCEDLNGRAMAVSALCKVPPSPEELGAMVSLAYNIGMGGFAKSTVLRQHNAGNRQAASRAFGLWNKAKGQELPGLTARRAKESALYLSGEPEPMPQAIEPESAPAAGGIAKGAAVVVGGGVLEAVSQAGTDIGTIKPAVDAAKDLLVNTLGIPTNWLLPIVVIGAGILILRWRLKQRSEGWC